MAAPSVALARPAIAALRRLRREDAESRPSSPSVPPPSARRSHRAVFERRPPCYVRQSRADAESALVLRQVRPPVYLARKFSIGSWRWIHNRKTLGDAAMRSWLSYPCDRS